MSTLPRLLIGCLLLIAVTLISERSKTFAGIVSTAPLNVPIILWILWGQTRGDSAALALTTRSMLGGIAATAIFILVCWLGFSRRWSLTPVLLAAYAGWAIVAFGPGLIHRLVERSAG
jgi:hypothetical protein